ncbi:MAG: pseudouridine-5'-phosphate glycosidase [Chloroflexi bacterium]|nr:pseudouridine-5'-phosphate glycosidase [Chloroflexota bacterium]
MKFHSDVQHALATNAPIVALESTVITHGLPYPANVETAVQMENAVRAGGATPATIAIIKGEIHVGLTPDELEYLGQRAGTAVRKCSRRDIPLAVAQKEDGATTVAGTMILAHHAGIPIFATGGIGGVHRGHPFDVSADLAELGRTPVTVVSSGAKSILDLPATREVLETNGVPIVGYGTDEMPAFFTPSSGLAVDIRLDTPEAVAGIIQAHQQLHLQNGILVTVPVPAADACDPDDVEAAIQQATAEADAQGVHGPESTPWLLQRVVALTNGRSMRANVALLKNNGRTAGQIASALCKMLT